MSVQYSNNNLKYGNMCYAKPQSNTVGFQGLNRCFSKYFAQTAEGVAKVIEAYPRSRNFVGNLPSSWIAGLPKRNRREQIQQIQDLFANLAETLYPPIFEKPSFENSVTDFSSKLSKILKIKVDINYIGRGQSGEAYKLEVGENRYVFKTFHADMSEFTSKLHGKTIEPSRAPFVNRKGYKSFVDFCFGKIGTNESKDGFMLTKYENREQNLTYQEEIKRLLKILKSPVSSVDINIGSEPKVFNDIGIIGLKAIDFGFMYRVPQNLNEALKKLAKDIEKYQFNTKKHLNKCLNNGTNNPLKKLIEFFEFNIKKKSSKTEDTPLEFILEKINKMKYLFYRYDINYCVQTNLEKTLQRLTALLQNPT